MQINKKDNVCNCSEYALLIVEGVTDRRLPCYSIIKLL